MLLALLLGGAGCVSNDFDELEAEDNGALGGGIEVRLSESVRLQATRMAFDSSERLNASENVSVGGPTFSGPTELDVDGDLTTVQLLLERAVHGAGPVQLRFFGGPIWTDLAFEVNEPGVARDRGHANTLGGTLGAELSTSLGEAVSVFGALAGSAGFGIDDDVEETRLWTFDAGLAFSLSERADLRVGWRHNDFESESEGSSGLGDDSELDFQFSGLFLLLSLGP